MDIDETTYYEDISDWENEVLSDDANTGKRRNYHNILERKRRNHIKDGYLRLRDAIPDLCQRKVSRIQILKKAVECIQAQEERISRCENNYREMRMRSEFLKRALDFMKTNDSYVR